MLKVYLETEILFNNFLPPCYVFLPANFLNKILSLTSFFFGFYSGDRVKTDWIFSFQESPVFTHTNTSCLILVHTCLPKLIIPENLGFGFYHSLYATASILMFSSKKVIFYQQFFTVDPTSQPECTGKMPSGI